jgi:hypothetical protein
MPDATESALAGGDFRLQQRPRGVAEQEIGMADDTGADRGRTVAAAGAHRRGAVGEFHLADRPHRFSPARAVHRACLDIDGRHDVVAGADVGGQIVDQVALAAAVPEMMMGIDDRAGRVDDVLPAQRQPVFARIGIEPAFRHGGSAGGHGSSLPDLLSSGQSGRSRPDASNPFEQTRCGTTGPLGRCSGGGRGCVWRNRHVDS